MLIEAGYKISYQCFGSVPMLLQLNVHPSRDADLRSPDVISSDPELPMRSYRDSFGNIVTRVEVPPGLVTFQNRFVVQDSGLPEETPIGRDQAPISELPDDALLFLLSSRYCDVDMLSDFAWSMFQNVKPGFDRVQAIVDYVHNQIRFSYADASSTRSASDALRDKVGVCRDFAHTAITLCRAMNIPARYCTGYLGDIGVPPDPAPMDFSAWFEVFLEGRWYAMDARHNQPRVGRIVMGRGRDAADVAISTSFGSARLDHFEVITFEKT